MEPEQATRGEDENVAGLLQPGDGEIQVNGGLDACLSIETACRCLEGLPYVCWQPARGYESC